MKEDEKLIWRRYVKWAHTARDVANRIDRMGSRHLPEGEDWLVGELLGEALIANQGWLADQALISRVLEKCFGESMCEELSDTAASAKPPLSSITARYNRPSGHRCSSGLRHSSVHHEIARPSCSKGSPVSSWYPVRPVAHDSRYRRPTQA